MSSPERVLRFERSDETGAFVLIHVSHQGPALLDLTLTATEGESPYVSVVKQARLKDLRAKSYQGSEDEWTGIVAFFLGQSPSSDRPDGVTGLEASASMSGSDQNKTLVITIRKRVQSITQRLGALSLKQDDEQSIELFDWTGISAARANDLEQQVSSLASRHTFAENTIKKLTQQLDELMDAKAHHENQLMANFTHILNEKKLKVRNQQRLLTAATVDPRRISEIQACMPTDNPDVHGSLHPAKRSAGSLSDTDTSDGFERMEIDQSKSGRVAVSGHDTDNERLSTPQSPEEDITSSTDDDSSQELPAQPKRVAQGSETAPPQRVLPFAKRTRDNSQSNVPTALKSNPEADAGETDDDEL
ncbi:DNA double-strand break repair and VJ recombination XRCC4 [Penicillium brevicompactum]|uniref:uncharacterized protein n=1 Tax=Penicillium brevicompactum TaxID=5074 RepID=UPI0025426346|nr:uncharacterized protein N7506_003180 [Penicillium brevicompactum]KAJ5343356.1 hypothetical protein N7506_003180 [Penicillium brevicompactum]